MTKPEFDIMFGLYAEEQGLSAEMRRQVLETVERTTAYTSVDEARDLYRMLDRLRDELGDKTAQVERPTPVVFIMPWGRLEFEIPADKLTPDVTDRIAQAGWGVSRLLWEHLLEHGVDLQELTGITLKDLQPPMVVPGPTQPQ